MAGIPGDGRQAGTNCHGVPLGSMRAAKDGREAVRFSAPGLGERSLAQPFWRDRKVAFAPSRISRPESREMLRWREFPVTADRPEPTAMASPWAQCALPRTAGKPSASARRVLESALWRNLSGATERLPSPSMRSVEGLRPGGLERRHALRIERTRGSGRRAAERVLEAGC